ncbi:MAG: SpoIIIAH-like family protein [Roseburia sp.]|nr:SpoIIIAH-like family protein [Roseburia sp.]
MKKIFRKNQLVITALALMIAVAGYFSYMNNNIEDKDIAASANADNANLDYEISDDALMEGEIFTDEGTGEDLVAAGDTQTMDTADAAGAENPLDIADTTGATGDTADVAAGADTAGTTDVAADTAVTGEIVADASGAESVENPGEAVLTSTSVANLDYAAEMKLNREQVRSKNKESLLEIVNNTTIAEGLKQDAVNKMIAMTDIAEREAAAEMLLEAKGFTDVVVSITDDSCDVVLNMGEVTDAKRAQVEDIVKRKTNVSAENIIITPIVIDNTAQE